ncbi:group III truncated hemoglobin [Flavobacterium oreochromis]|uniref:Globin n=2 Tax=Flavobacterium TaxID=237 RepID=A0A2D0AI36_9FLAO|nr:group III truncated hemoglobin [Flavobacterium oreochromis]OWP77150.1 globin [Flavobacterium oreochromis]OWP79481.1 globin [Flavobacterium oreochromis]POR28378.1 globin [Flavobacterium columnare]QYS85319.1 group III truncated hemoglobin [Flavobacterium oreochromis]
MKDIQNRSDIELLVNTFYNNAKIDTLIGPIFNGAIKDWTPHLNKMYTFWETILLEVHSYSGTPFPPHAKMPLEKIHFDRWMELFKKTVDSLFTGEKANEAKWRAGKMAELFEYKIEYFKKANHKPLL